MANLLGRFGNFLNDAGQHMQGLQSDPMFNMGVGLLAAGGNRRGPKVSFGQGLAEAMQFTNSQMSQAQKLEAQRQALQQSQQRQQAMERIPSLLNAGNVPPSIRAPQSLLNSRLDSALIQAAPEQMTQSLINSRFAQQRPQTSSTFADFVALGGDPQDIQAFQEFAGRGPSAIDEINARLAAMQAEREQASLKQTQEERDIAKRTRQTGRQATVREIKKLVDNLKSVAGTVAQPGFFGQAAQSGLSLRAAIENIAGLPGTNARSLASKSEQLEKGFGRLIGQTIPDAFLGSDRRLQFYQNQSPGLSQQPETNLAIMEQILNDVITDDFRDDGEINSSGEAQELLRQVQELRNQFSSPSQIPAPPPGAVIDR